MDVAEGRKTETPVQEIVPEGLIDEEGLQELLFERLGLVLLPPGAGTGTAAGRPGKGSTTKEPTLDDFVTKTRELLQQEEQQEVEQAEAELSNYSPSGAQVFVLNMYVQCSTRLCASHCQIRFIHSRMSSDVLH